MKEKSKEIIVMGKPQRSPVSYVRVPCALKGDPTQCPHPECDGTYNRLCTRWENQSSR